MSKRQTQGNERGGNGGLSRSEDRTSDGVATLSYDGQTGISIQVTSTTGNGVATLSNTRSRHGVGGLDKDGVATLSNKKRKCEDDNEPVS